MKIAVAGAGALGGRVGAHLKEGGFDVTLIDYWEEHVEYINKNGLEIQTEEENYKVPIQAKLVKEVKETYDLIIVLTKATQASEMLEELKEREAIDQDTSIITLMNGLALEDMLAKFVPEENLFLAVTMWTANLRGPGKITMEGTGNIEMQRADGQVSDKTHEINKLFNEAKLNSKITDTVQNSIWFKASFNSIFNPLCSILDKTTGELVAYENIIDMIRPIVEEIAEVAKSRDVMIDPEIVVNMIANAPTDGRHYPSMHHDLNRGVQTEIDFLNGKIATLGKENGIETPVNEMITHFIHQLETKNE